MKVVTDQVRALTSEVHKLTATQNQNTQAQRQAADAATKSAKSLDETAKATQRAHQQHTNYLSGLTRSIAIYVAAYESAKLLWGLVSSSVRGAVNIIDDFNKASIGTASAITNIANKALLFGKSWDDVFNRNLKETKVVFFELEKLAARYFASSTDLQLAYNAFAQRGVVIRKEELEQLAQLTDMILLLTQGQQTTIQVQEEIRSLINGTIRPTAQLAQLIKSFGLDVKQVAAEIKATQSLKPLESILVGAKSATGEIQKTFQAVLNGFETVRNQLVRSAGQEFFGRITAALQHFSDFISRNQEKIAALAAVLGNVVASAITGIERLSEKLISGSAAAAGFNNPLLYIIATIQVLSDKFVRLLAMIALFVTQLPNIGAIIYQSLFGDKKIKDGFKEIFDIFKDITSLFGNFNIFEDIKDQVGSLNKSIADALANVKKLADQESPGFQATFIPFKPSDEQKAELKRAENAAREAERRYLTAKRTTTNIFEAGIIETQLTKLRRDFQFLEQGFEIHKGIIGELHTVQGALQEFNQVNVRSFVEGIAFNRERLFESVRRVVVGTNERIISNLDDQLARVKRGLDSFIAEAKANAAELTEQTAGPVRQQAENILKEATDKFNTIRDEFERQLSRAESKFNLVSALVNQPAQGQAALDKQITDATQTLTEAEAKASELKATLADIENQAKSSANITNFLKEVNAEGLQEQLQGELKIIKAVKIDLEELFKIKGASKERLTEMISEFAKAVQEVRDRMAGGLLHAGGELAAEQSLATSKELEASAIEARNNEKAAADIQTERNRLLQDEQRIRQTIQDIQAKTNSLIQEANIEATKIKVQTARDTTPTTTFEKETGRIQQDRSAFDSQIAAGQGNIDFLMNQATALADTMPELSAEMMTQVQIQQLALDEAARTGEEAFRNQERFAGLRVSIEALGNAADAVSDTLATALTQSFEGKATDFKRAFKGIADSLFKDSLKNVFETIKTDLQKGFKAVFDSLDVSGDMAKTLGPAFTAGFALIASFVLGQLLGDQGGEATAGNPTVGIQSSEQVRGLIGGETQIPIGQIGESLQDALVPTNLLLARIAGGVDRLAAGGFSSGQIETIIERSVNEALQIQPA
jgi:hypothetical protein